MISRNYKYRCDYCGKFISNKDIWDETAVIDGVHLEWDGYSNEPDEVYPAYHAECKRKYMERYKEA